jgi:hypothetical protein
MVPDSDKCGHTGTAVGTTTGGGLSKMFDVQTNSFKVYELRLLGAVPGRHGRRQRHRRRVPRLMAGHGAVVVLFPFVGLLAPLALYYLVRAEHDEREAMSRAEAERVARRAVDEDVR